MKTLWLIGGLMGVGKTTVCQQLKRDLPRAVFLDGDWCWDADPFQVTEETKAMVLDNICHTLNNFLRCSVYENVIFCWVMHQQAIIDTILAGLDREGCTVKCVSLLADREELRKRLAADIERGVRSAGVIGRSEERLPLYKFLSTVKVDTTGKTVRQVAGELERL